MSGEQNTPKCPSQAEIERAIHICNRNAQEWKDKGDPASLEEAEQWLDQGLLLGVLARFLRSETASTDDRALRVPVCGSPPLTVSRAIWDEAWIEYEKKYRGGDSQHRRLLHEGFYASELDELRPGWRPVDQRIQELEKSALLPRSATLPIDENLIANAHAAKAVGMTRVTMSVAVEDILNAVDSRAKK